jgi:WD40 repeat protein
LISGSVDKTARVYDLSTGQCRASLQGHSGWITACTLQGSIALTASNDSVIRIWNLASIPDVDDGSPFIASSNLYADDDADDMVFSGSLVGHTQGITSIWLEDGSLFLLIIVGIVATGSVDKTVRCWDLETRKCINILKSERWVEKTDSGLGFADSLVYGENIDQSPPKSDGHLIDEIWKDKKSNISIFDNEPSSGYLVQNIGGQVGALQFWQHALAAGYGDGIIRLFDLRSGVCNRILYIDSKSNL